MKIQWTNIAGCGPSAWNHGGPPVKMMIKVPKEDSKGVHGPIHIDPDLHAMAEARGEYRELE